MAQTTIAYLERRYAALESEIADALSQSPTDELAIADLKYRKLIIADEIQHNRRLVERFGKLSLLLGYPCLIPSADFNYARRSDFVDSVRTSTRTTLAG